MDLVTNESTDLRPARLGDLPGNGGMTLKAGDFAGYVPDRGTFVVDDSVSRKEVEALEGFALIYTGPVSGLTGSVVIKQCYIEAMKDFPTITFYTTSQETFV